MVRCRKGRLWFMYLPVRTILITTCGRSVHINACNRPISTYGGRGVGKRGVPKWQHCIIYTDKQAPGELPGEAPGYNEQAMRTPIRVRPTNSTDIMDPASRLHYGKMYTVEHNVKVYDFGMVRSDHLPTLDAQWRQVLNWESQNSARSSQDTTTSSHDYGAYRTQYGSSPQQSVGSSRGYNNLPSVPEAPATHLPTYVDYGCASVDYGPEEGQTRQIAIKKDDRLAILEWPYPEWAKAWNQRSNETGLVPLQYITMFASAVAKYTYEPDTSQGYLALRKDDQLRIIEYPTDDWARAWNQRTAETGLVPRNYISLLSKQKA
jgi:hypothetical protein